jgi:hypothetical protein
MEGGSICLETNSQDTSPQEEARGRRQSGRHFGGVRTFFLVKKIVESC